MARLSYSVYCDESKASGFVLAASYMPCGEVPRIRGVVDHLRLQRQVRIHFRREEDSRKERILAALIELGCISSVVYDAQGHSLKDGRDLAIARMADDCALAAIGRIVLETDDSARLQDKQIISARLTMAGRETQTSFTHMRASDDGVLGVPDTVAWCYAKGGAWLRRAEPLIKEVICL
jgi:hypothetical protein